MNSHQDGFLEENLPWLDDNGSGPGGRRNLDSFDRRIPPVITGLLAQSCSLCFQDGRRICFGKGEESERDAYADPDGNDPEQPPSEFRSIYFFHVQHI